MGKDYKDYTPSTEELEAYLENSGNCCPFCGSREVDQGKLEATLEAAVFQDRFCNSCFRDWTDEYSLTGFMVLD